VEAMLYRFPCPRCGTEVASNDTVTIDEFRASDGTLTRVRIHSSTRLLHECEGEEELLESRATRD